MRKTHCDSAVQARHPLSPEAALGEMVRLHVRGNVPEPLWRDIILRNCRPKVGVQGRPAACRQQYHKGGSLLVLLKGCPALHWPA